MPKIISPLFVLIYYLCEMAWLAENAESPDPFWTIPESENFVVIE